MTTKKGKVYLVGAGPGDPKLITVRGLQCIKEADVLIYDNLASRELTEQAKPGAELVFVGKWRGKHTMKQADINKLLVDKSKQGFTVTRLKGGDSFIFGRGGEEAEFLHAHGIYFEIIPGITSAYGVPAYAGIPLTHRSMASSVLLLTGHEDPNKSESSIDWSRVSNSTDTIVILMGVKNLPHIVKNLIANGRDPKTPIALIRWGTTPRQEMVTGTLNDIVGKAQANNVRPPAVTVIGDVVNLHEKLSWYEKKPLYGKRLIVTRAKGQAAKFITKIEELGGIVIEVPTIKIVEPDDSAPLDSAINRLNVGQGFDWTIFTSANTVSAVAKRFKLLQLDINLLAKTKIAAIGKSTADALETYGLKPSFIPQNFVAESAVDGFLRVAKKGGTVFHPRAQIARNIIPDALSGSGFEVHVAPAYKNIPVNEIEPYVMKELTSKPVDYITFTSSSTAVNFFKLVETYDLGPIIKKTKLASIGPITSKTIEDLRFSVAVQAEEFTTKGLVDVLIEDCLGNSS